MEGTEPRVPSNRDQDESVVVAQAVPPPAARPPRRRRSALLGGGALVAGSPVAVGTGSFVAGFTALGLGALLLLLPPRVRPEDRHRSRLRVVLVPLTAAGRAIRAVVRGTAELGARAFRAGVRFVTGTGRDVVTRGGRATLRGIAVTAAGASAAASRAGRTLLAAVRRLARDAGTASTFVLTRGRPMLGRAWSAGVAGSVRGGQEFDALARSASERLSAAIDTKRERQRLASRPTRAARAPFPGPRPPIPRGRSRHRSGQRGRSSGGR